MASGDGRMRIALLRRRGGGDAVARSQIFRLLMLMLL